MFLLSAVQTSLSFVISFLSSILIFSAMQFCKQFFLSSQFLTIFAGVVGSWFFILSLTVSFIFSMLFQALTSTFQLQAISNLESILLGKGFQSRWIEVFISLTMACFACSTIHRVAVTTCLLSSFIGLHYVNKISQKFHTTAPVVVVDAKKKKK
jgi:Keratinocyte-associated protein 2